MSAALSSVGILAEDAGEERERIAEMLTKAYSMEIETVMSYLANSVNPDGYQTR
jgi:bacterioferritin